MSQPLGLALSSTAALVVSAYVCFHPAEVVDMFRRARSGAAIDATSLRLLRYFALARIVGLLGLAWASPDPTVALLGAVLMTAHAAFCDAAWRYHWPVLTITRILGALIIVQALVLRLDPVPQSRMAQALVGVVLLVKPNAGGGETFDVPSETQLFGTRLVAAIGTVAFGAATMHLLIEPTLLLFYRLADVEGSTPP
jgi:hypothetical protein